jgi:SOS-response transcriptional repressor LexA
MAKEIEIPEEWPAWKKEIAVFLNARGLSMKEASLRANLGETFVRDALKRDKEPAHKNLLKLRTAIGLESAPSILEVTGLPIAGKAQAGSYLDVSLVDEIPEEELERIQVARDPRYPHAKQYALLIVGDSMNKKLDDGSYATCVRWAETGLLPQPGMLLHVERRQGHLVEVTVKCLAIRDGKYFFDPMSTNPLHKPIALDGDAGTEIEIVGLVTGSWKPISF